MKKITAKKVWISYGVAFLLVMVIYVGILWGFASVGKACNAALGVTYYTIDAETIPDEFAGFRIAQISDLHNAQFGIGNKRLLSLLKETAPDIIAITGDLVDSDRTDIEVAIAFAREAMEIAPCYYVIGNNEATIDEYNRLEKELIEAGVVVLRDESVEVEYNGARLQVVGYDDPSYIWYRDKLKRDVAKQVAKAAGASEEELAKVNKGLSYTDEEYEKRNIRRLQDLGIQQQDFTILLSHRPELFGEYCKVEADVVLAGHAHGGQIRIDGIGGIYAPGQGWFPKYDSGVFVDRDTHMIVSRGLGNSSFPFRINNPPEIVVVDIQ